MQAKDKSSQDQLAIQSRSISNQISKNKKSGAWEGSRHKYSNNSNQKSEGSWWYIPGNQGKLGTSPPWWDRCGERKLISGSKKNLCHVHNLVGAKK